MREATIGSHRFPVLFLFCRFLYDITLSRTGTTRFTLDMLLVVESWK